jgi:hypothetical protein
MVSPGRCSFEIVQAIDTLRSLLVGHIAERLLGSHNDVCRRHFALQRLGADYGEFQSDSSCFELTLGSSLSQVANRHSTFHYILLHYIIYYYIICTIRFRTFCLLGCCRKT